MIESFKQSNYGTLDSDSVAIWLNNANKFKVAVEIETEFKNDPFNRHCNDCFNEFNYTECHNCSSRTRSCYNNITSCDKFIRDINEFAKTCTHRTSARLCLENRCYHCNHFNYELNSPCMGCEEAITGCDSYSCNIPKLENKCKECSSTKSIYYELHHLLKPTHSYNFNLGGVSEVKTDGSLRSGLEITTPGLFYDFDNNYKIYNDITKALLSKNAVTNYRCGGHMHLFLDYSTIGDTRSNIIKKSPIDYIPQIIYANLYQLTRLYMPEILWLTATSLTRDNNYRKYECLLEHSALKYKDIYNLQHSIRDRYSFLNLLNTKFKNNNNDLLTFHMEYRVPDGCLSPSVWIAWSTLFNAMLIKSVKYSEYGLIFNNKKEYWNKQKRLLNSYFSDRCKNDREEIKTNTKVFLESLKREINSLSPIAWHILSSLADMPVILMANTDAINASKWTKIEKTLYQKHNIIVLSELNKMVDLQAKVRFILDSSIFKGVSRSKWVAEVSRTLNIPIIQLTSELDKIGVKYNNNVGSFEVA